MKQFANLLILALSLFTAAPMWAQSPGSATAPQTARQALIEMFFSKTPGTLVKHLPAATLSTLDKSGALAALQPYLLLASQAQAGQAQAKGKVYETFATGSVILAADNPQTGQKSEIIVESDSLQGDEDDIEVSFKVYKDNQPQRTPFLPRMTFAMKMESGVWKLNEIQVTVRVPLADPDFLKSIAEAMKAQTAVATTMHPNSQLSTTTFGTDAQALAALRSILTAESVYSSTYPTVGYTCTLSDLDGFGGGEPNEHQAMLIASGLASGRKYGYTFTLTGCTGNPATSFHIVAMPSLVTTGGNSFGRRAFCSDQTGAIRSSADGNPATCLASGIPAQ